MAAVLVVVALTVAGIWLAAMPRAGAVTPLSASASEFVLSGRVFEGNFGYESAPISGVTVSLYCSNNVNQKGTFVHSYTTDSNGWYELAAPEVCEFYNIVETNLSGYTSVGASSVSGTVKPDDLDWIQYIYPLTGKTLSGNKFWDKHIVTSTPTATRTPTFTSAPPATATSTSTGTPAAPTATSTRTHTSAALTQTPTVTSTRTHTSGAATQTPTPTSTGTHTPTPTVTHTPGGPIVREFTGQVFQALVNGEVVPWPSIPLVLFKAQVPCEQGSAVAVAMTDEFGKFLLANMTTAEEDAPYYNLAIGREDIQVRSAQSASGGQLTTQGWLQFAGPAGGEFVNNNFVGKLTTGQTVTYYAFMDSYISSTSDTTNFGDEAELRTGYGGGIEPGKNRAVLRFWFEGIHTGTDITKATLHLYMESASGAEKACLTVHDLQEEWREDQVTWDNQPTYESDYAGSQAVDKTAGYKTWDVTAWAQGEAPCLGECYGLALVGPETGTSGWGRIFQSMEGTNRPYITLVVESDTPIQTPVPPSTVTPTPTPTRTGTPVVRDVEIYAVEFNQSIQNLYSTGVPLFAGKDAVVRVHLHTTDGKGNIAGVTGVIYYPYTSYGYTTYKPINTASTVTVRASPDRGQFNQSLNFFIPGTDLTQGTGMMRILIKPPAGVTFSSGSQLERFQQFTITTGPTLNVVVVEVYYDQGGTERGPHANAENDVRSWLERAYPVSEVQTTNHPLAIKYLKAPGDFCDGGAFASINNGLAKWRSSSDSTYGISLGAHTLYYGMVPDDYLTLCTDKKIVGKANGIPSGEASGAVRSTDADWGGENAGHELGHCLKLKHAECCDAPSGEYFPNPGCAISWGWIYYGMDTLNRTVLPPSTRDFMTYCPDPWMSDYNYGRLKGNITLYPLAAQATEPGDMLMISGLINKTKGETTLDPIYRMPLLPPEPSEPSACMVRVFNGFGHLLAEHPFKPGEDTEPIPGKDEILTIHRVVPDHPELARVDIVCDGQTLASRAATAHAPFVHVDGPNGGEFWATGTQTITWHAEDPDGDTLYFLLQASGDDGATWTTLAADVTGRSFSFDTALLPGGDQIRIRVVGTDGLRTMWDTSDGAFTVVPKPPQVTIESPRQGARFLPGDVVVFSGYAYDPEDGPLPPSALSWASDRDGPLGTGSALELDTLSFGKHAITLTATDSDSQTSTATANVVIAYPAYLPVIMR